MPINFPEREICIQISCNKLKIPDREIPKLHSCLRLINMRLSLI